VKIDQAQARAIIAKVREAKNELRCILAHGDLCDRSRSALLCLDVAELLAADETTHECSEPREILILSQFIEAMGLFKRTWLDRLNRHPEAARIVTG